MTIWRNDVFLISKYRTSRTNLFYFFSFFLSFFLFSSIQNFFSFFSLLCLSQNFCPKNSKTFLLFSSFSFFSSFSSSSPVVFPKLFAALIAYTFSLSFDQFPSHSLLFFSSSFASSSFLSLSLEINFIVDFQLFFLFHYRTVPKYFFHFFVAFFALFTISLNFDWNK